MMCFLQGSIRSWTQPEVVTQEVLVIATLLTLAYFLWSFKKTLGDSYYSALDTMYFELLKIAVERPYLLDPASLKDDEDKRKEYDAYAFMVWNFIETIFDRCQKNKRLRDTWYPIIDTENDRHRAWFDLPANRSKFKKAFVDFIQMRYQRIRVELAAIETQEMGACSPAKSQGSRASEAK